MTSEVSQAAFGCPIRMRPLPNLGQTWSERRLALVALAKIKSKQTSKSLSLFHLTAPPLKQELIASMLDNETRPVLGQVSKHSWFLLDSHVLDHGKHLLGRDVHRQKPLEDCSRHRPSFLKD